MFRGKESSNRIELSRLVQELLNFGVLGSLQLWGRGWGDGWGVPPTHMHMHAHKHVKHDNFNCKWQPPLGEFPMMSYVRTHACACVGGIISPNPHPIHPPPIPQGGTPGISQNSIALKLIEIFQFCLKI